MSEILFRGKDLQEQNGWLYGYFYKSDINKRERESGKATLIFTPNCDTFIYVPEYHNSWMVKSETVGRYTGLTDKNGTRIFEGDIIKSKQDGMIGVIRFGEYQTTNSENGECHLGFSIEWYGKYSGLLRKDLGWWINLKIIGNIYDNPELLKGEKNETTT